MLGTWILILESHLCSEKSVCVALLNPRVTCSMKSKLEILLENPTSPGREKGTKCQEVE